MLHNKILLVFTTLYCFSSSLEVPANFKQCRRSVSNQELSKCLLEAISVALPTLEKGLPEFGLDSCEPVKIKNFTVGEGKGVVHVVQNYKDVGIYNLIHSKVKSVNATLTDKELHLRIEAYSDHLLLKSHYNMNGHLLVFQLYGNGQNTIDLYKVKMLVSLTGTIYKKHNEDYMSFKDVQIRILPKKLRYNFENLFDGNKLLGDNINKILNDNDLDVYLDVATGYEVAIADILKNIANTIVTKLPVNKWFLP